MALYPVRVTPKTALTGGSESAECLNIEPGSCANLKQWIYWPQRCPCCGGTSDAYTDLRWSRPRGSEPAGVIWYSVRIPYCRTCLDHAKAAAGASRTALGSGLLVSLALLVPATIILGRGGFTAMTLLAVLTASAGGGLFEAAAAYRLHNAKVRRMLREGCSSPYAAVNAGGCEGSGHRFLFRSREYADDFAQMNGAEVEQAG